MEIHFFEHKTYIFLENILFLEKLEKALPISTVSLVMRQYLKSGLGISYKPILIEMQSTKSPSDVFLIGSIGECVLMCLLMLPKIQYKC